MGCPDNNHAFEAIKPPLSYLPFILAERFTGTTPDQYLDMPTDRRAYLLSVMSIEGQINKTWAEANEDVEAGTEVWIAEWELELWEDA